MNSISCVKEETHKEKEKSFLKLQLSQFSLDSHDNDSALDCIEKVIL